MERLFIMGMKHSGKTTLAERISSRLGSARQDTDALLEKRFSPLTVREWYRKNGKEAFMREEYLALRDFLEDAPESCIISLGGGAADNDGLLTYIRDRGKSIYLHRAEELILPVVLRDGIPPFLSEEDPAGSFHEIYERRDGVYRREADITVELGGYGDIDRDTDTILSVLKESL